MYQDYDRAANQVINHLTKRHCASSIIYMNKRCFRLFKEYMIEKNIEYSQELIIDWLEDCIRHLCTTTVPASSHDYAFLVPFAPPGFKLRRQGNLTSGGFLDGAYTCGKPTAIAIMSICD